MEVGGETDGVGRATEPVVYGDDDRTDVFAHPDGWLQALARQSTVALMEDAMLNTSDPSNITLNARPLGFALSLCPGEPFFGDPSAAFCSGTLIDDDLVLTAGHCIDASTCPNTSFVFNYHRTSAGTLHRITSQDVFECEDVVVRQVAGADYAVVRLDRPATPRFRPVPIRHSMAALDSGQGLAVIGFGSGIPAKIDDGGTVQDPRAGTLDFFVANTDTFVFNSGSGVYDLDTYLLTGILVRGETDYVWNRWLRCFVVNELDDDEGGEEITYVRYALDAYCDEVDFANSRLCGWAPLLTPHNDSHGNAVEIPLDDDETTVTGSTTFATQDGPIPDCGCSGAGSESRNVWYSFTLTEEEVVYLDTAGSSYDTSLFLTDPDGFLLPAQAFRRDGLCNDDAGCTTGGFTSGLQPRTAGVLDPGTYYVAVGGCGRGSFRLNVQHIPTRWASYFYDTPIEYEGSASTVLVGSSRTTSSCGGSSSGEDARWFVTCGGRAQLFSLCASDGGTYSRYRYGHWYDPVLYIRSATGGTVCNDDGGSWGGSDCRGTGGDSRHYGSRIGGAVVGRGLHAVFVDSRSGGSGMTYTLQYDIAR